MTPRQSPWMAGSGGDAELSSARQIATRLARRCAGTSLPVPCLRTETSTGLHQQQIAACPPRWTVPICAAGDWGTVVYPYPSIQGRCQRPRCPAIVSRCRRCSTLCPLRRRWLLWDQYRTSSVHLALHRARPPSPSQKWQGQLALCVEWPTVRPEGRGVSQTGCQRAKPTVSTA